ncbi:MAG: DUF975 family protein [Clostridia bacterium]|nr:DUF975 family protein [Clostridia bacterium]
MTQATPTPARELRRKALAELETTWPTLLALTLVISLISFFAGLFSGIPLFSLVVSLLLSIPTMGILKGKLAHLRGTPLQFDCFSGMFPHWTKVICYELWVMLFTFLWMLPGLLPAFIGGVMGGVGLRDGSGDVSVAGVLIALVGLVLMLVLLFRMTLNYMVSSCLLVDNPDMGGLVTLEKSKDMMRGNRWRFVKMNLPIFLMQLVLILLVVLLGDTWFASLLYSVVSTAIAVLMAFFQPVFYRDLLGEG